MWFKDSENKNKMMETKDRLLKQFDWVNHWFTNALDGFTDEESNRRVSPHMNHVKYLAGHLVNAQYGLEPVAGINIERKWDDLFAGLGQTKAQDNFPYPSIDEIKEEWKKIYHALRKSLEKLSVKDLAGEMPDGGMGASGIFDGSKGDYWAFINLHQMYHVGQISLLRRGFEKPAMKLF